MTDLQPPENSRTHFAPIVMAIIALSSLALLGLADFRKSSPKLAVTAVTNGSSVSNTSTSVEDLAQDPELAVVPQNLSDATKELMLECVRGVDSLRGVTSRLDFATMDQYLEKAISPSGDRPHQSVIQAQTLFLIDRSGRQLRLDLKPETDPKNHGVQVQAKLFELVDSHRFMPVALMPDLAQGTVKKAGFSGALDTIVARFKSHGRLVSEEVSELKRWDEAMGALIKRRNGRISKFRIFFQDGTLNCGETYQAQVECSCLR